MSLRLIYDENLGHFRPMSHVTDVLAELRRPSAPKYHYLRNWQSATSKDVGSILETKPEEFHVNLDVQHFTSDEIVVKINGRTIVVEGSHPERLDEHGFVSRKFVRKYILPECYNVAEVSSKMSSDGILTITAPKMQKIETEVPVVLTGIPHKQTDNK